MNPETCNLIHDCFVGICLTVVAIAYFKFLTKA